MKGNDTWSHLITESRNMLRTGIKIACGDHPRAAI